MYYKCVLGRKIGDSLIRTDDGSLQPIFPDVFYVQGTMGYWLLRRISNTYKIERFLRSDCEINK